MADARELIRVKRDGGTHPPADLEGLVAGFARGDVADYQMSAWLMAAFLRGLDDDETGALTRALLRSGRQFDWRGLNRPSADKHSTGGVGDKISLVLAPLVAACDVLVPMVSGRGLGHTGGTLDKLESIPGFKTTLPPDDLRRQLDEVGVFMVGQGPDLAPADGRLYALRDVTATVEFEPFIVSSIVSKKIAEGAGALVYDVKTGDGAFMRTRERARGLAERLVRASRSLGAKASAFVTDMSQPLGRAAGNALEVVESVEVLTGGGPDDVRSLTLALAARMIALSGAERDDASARARAQRALDSGLAWQKFLAMVRAQGGDASALERNPERLAPAPHVETVHADRAGTLVTVRTFELGELIVRMGGGRLAQEDVIDPRVGVRVLRRVGDRLASGDAIAEVHAADAASDWIRRVRACFVIEDRAVSPPKLILDEVP